jgi:hypothetical protein
LSDVAVEYKTLLFEPFTDKNNCAPLVLFKYKFVYPALEGAVPPTLKFVPSNVSADPVVSALVDEA